MQISMAPSNGFTLVEAIVAILLIGIVSATVISRFADGNAFNTIILRDHIVSLARTAQQSSLGRDGVTLTITPDVSGNSVVVATSDVGGTIQSISADLRGISLSGDINNTDSCASTSGANSITSATPMTLNFEALGNLGDSGVTGSVGSINSTIRVCINNDAQASVCVSPSGYAYAGDCDI